MIWMMEGGSAESNGFPRNIFKEVEFEQKQKSNLHGAYGSYDYESLFGAQLICCLQIVPECDHQESCWGDDGVSDQ